MTEVFVDTSAIYAALIKSDVRYSQASRSFSELAASKLRLVSSSFVIHETAALLQRRFGIAAVRSLWSDFYPAFDVVTVDRAMLERAMSALLAASRRDISLTDWTSFEIMRQRPIDRALAFDRHFTEQGFSLIIDS